MSPVSPRVVCECLTEEQLARDKTWWTIYEKEFPIEEREPPQVALDMLRAERGLVVRAHCEGVTCGLATAHLLRQPPAVFLLYLASVPEMRGQGIGTRLMEYAWQKGAERLGERGLSAIGLIWEVENPALAASAEEQQQRQQRLTFYQRRGGHLLSCAYTQPPLHGGEAVPLALMFRPTLGTKLPGEKTMVALVRSIYFEKFAAINKIPVEVLDALLSNLSN